MITHYAERLEEDFGVEVEFRDRTVGEDSSAAMVERLRESTYLRRDLAEADVVILDIPFDAWARSLQTVSGAPGGVPSGCGGDDGEECLREVLALYEENTETIFRELTAIADPSETLIRATDYILVHMKDLGDALDVVAPYWVEGQKHVEEVAAEYGIQVANVMERFCGRDCLEDPVDAGLIVSDQEHPTREGAELMAEMMIDLGYELSD